MEKKFTMVARYVDPATNETSGILMLDSNYGITSLSNAKAMELAMHGIIENLDCKNGELIGGNGSLKRYTTINKLNNSIIGVPRSVVLSRLEDDNSGELAGYIIYGANGVVAQVSVETAVALVQNDALVNGKLRSTKRGLIVSSINGEYPVSPVLSQQKEVDKKVSMDLVMFREASNGSDETKVVRGATIGLKYSNAIAMKNDYPRLAEASKRLTEQLTAIGVKPDIAEIKAVGSMVFAEVPFDAFVNIFRRPECTLLDESKPVIICSRDAKNEESAIEYSNGVPKLLGTGTEETQRHIKAFTKKVIGTLTQVK